MLLFEGAAGQTVLFTVLGSCMLRHSSCTGKCTAMSFRAVCIPGVLTLEQKGLKSLLLCTIILHNFDIPTLPTYICTRYERTSVSDLCSKLYPVISVPKIQKLQHSYALGTVCDDCGESCHDDIPLLRHESWWQSSSN